MSLIYHLFIQFLPRSYTPAELKSCLESTFRGTITELGLPLHRDLGLATLVTEYAPGLPLRLNFAGTSLRIQFNRNYPKLQSPTVALPALAKPTAPFNPVFPTPITAPTVGTYVNISPTPISTPAPIAIPAPVATPEFQIDDIVKPFGGSAHGEVQNIDPVENIITVNYPGSGRVVQYEKEELVLVMPFSAGPITPPASFALGKSVEISLKSDIAATNENEQKNNIITPLLSLLPPPAKFEEITENGITLKAFGRATLEVNTSGDKNLVPGLDDKYIPDLKLFETLAFAVKACDNIMLVGPTGLTAISDSSHLAALHLHYITKPTQAGDFRF